MYGLLIVDSNYFVQLVYILIDYLVHSADCLVSLAIAFSCGCFAVLLKSFIINVLYLLDFVHCCFCCIISAYICDVVNKCNVFVY